MAHRRPLDLAVFLSVLSVPLLAVLHQPAFAAPKIFSDFSLLEAQEAAKKDNRLLLVDFTARWCEPCLNMDRTTWTSPVMKEWFDDYGIAIQVDYDKQPLIARALGVTTLPAMLIFSPKQISREVDRRIGFKDPLRLIAWMNRIRQEEGLVDERKESFIRSKGQGGKTEINARQELVRELIGEGKYDKATEQYVWLWQTIETDFPGLIAMRNSSMASDMTKLTSIYEPARKQFAELRDMSQHEDRQDWVVLNDVVHEPQKTLQWFDEIKKDPGQTAILQQLSPRLERLLIERGRWADTTLLYGDPIAELKKRHEFSSYLHIHITEGAVNQFPKEAGQIYASLLAAGREQDAANVARESLALEDTPTVKQQLVVNALAAGQPRPQQIPWALCDPSLAAKLLGGCLAVTAAVFASLAFLFRTFGKGLKRQKQLRMEAQWLDVPAGVLTDCRAIKGAWSGAYEYPDKWQLVVGKEKFAASFANNHRTFTGTMTDSLGEAGITGWIKYPAIRFKKTYSQSAKGKSAGAVFYFEGKFVDNENASGEWFMSPFDKDAWRGSWTMTRN